jgi:hypothetical protein
MAGITGDFESAIGEASRVLAVRGRILPSSLAIWCCALRCARPSDPDAVPPHSGGRIRHRPLPRASSSGCSCRRSNPRATRPAIQALLSADLIILGPGQPVHPAVLPKICLVPTISPSGCAGLGPAVKSMCAQNVCHAGQGETEGYTVGDHVRALNAHWARGCAHVWVCRPTGNYRITLRFHFAQYHGTKPEFEGRPRLLSSCWRIWWLRAGLAGTIPPPPGRRGCCGYYHDWRAAAQSTEDPSWDPFTTSSLR